MEMKKMAKKELDCQHQLGQKRKEIQHA